LEGKKTLDLRADKITMRKRIMLLERVIAQRGWNYSIQKELADNWGVTDRYVRMLKEVWIKKRSSRFSEYAENSREEILLQLNETYAKALADKKYGPAATTLRIKAELLGLMQTKIELSTPKPLQYADLSGMSPEQLRALAEEKE